MLEGCGGKKLTSWIVAGRGREEGRPRDKLHTSKARTL
jgi:hypothetical protein